MKYNIEKVLIIFFILIIGSNSLYGANEDLTIFYPNYFDEQNNIFEDIPFLQNEILSFEYCNKDEIEISAQILCNDGNNKKLELYHNEKSKCYYSNNNIADFSCSEFSLEITYNLEGREKIISRDFVEEKESTAVNKVLEKDFTSLNDLDLSYYLLTLHLIDESPTQDKNDIYEILKNNRNNELKCWPNNNCDLLTTAKIINNLKLSGYEDTTRLIEDGRIYMEKSVLKDEEISFSTQSATNFDYEVEIEIEHNFGTNEEIECDLNLDNGAEERTYSFDDDSDLEELRVYKRAEEEIDFDCDQNVDKIIFSIYDETITQDFSTNEDRISYSISDNDLDEFSEFNLQIKFKHNFGINDEISCDLDLDNGENEESYTFDENSDIDDLIINEKFDEEFELDCDDNFDEVYYVVYGGELTVEEVQNTDKNNYEIDVTDDDKFNFQIFIDYEFENDDEELVCTLNYDTKSRTFTFQEDDLISNRLEISRYFVSNSLSLNCDKTLDKIEYQLFDKFNKKQIDEEQEDITSISKSVPSEFSEYSCISENGNTCDYETTILANEILDSSYEEKANVERFIKSFKVEDDNEKEFIIDQNKYLDSGIFIFYNKDEDIIDSLKFSQNNDGSWGSGTTSEKALQTFWISLGIEKQNSDNEYIDDSKKWIYFNEPTVGWGSTERNAISFLAIQEQIKPYLKLNIVNMINKEFTFDIENPTIYNLQNVEIEFNNEIAKYLEYTSSLEDFNANEKRNVPIKIKDSFSGKVTGEMTITGFRNKKEIELLKIPISIEASFPFEIANNEISTIEGDIFTKIPLTPKAEEYSLSCVVKNPFESRDETFTITQETTEIQLSNIASSVGEYDILFTCTSDTGSVRESQSIIVSLLAKTFSTSYDEISLLDETEFSIDITNQIETSQNLELSVYGDYIGILTPAEPTKMLAFNETRSIYYTVTNDVLLEALGPTAQGGILVNGANYSKEIPIIFGSENESQTTTSIPWMWIILLVVILAVAGIVLIRYNNMKNQDNNQANNVHEDDEELYLDEDMDFK